jgi:hypothetical protein
MFWQGVTRGFLGKSSGNELDFDGFEVDCAGAQETRLDADGQESAVVLVANGRLPFGESESCSSHEGGRDAVDSSK